MADTKVLVLVGSLRAASPRSTGAAGVIGRPAMGRFVGRSCANPSLMKKL